MDELIQQFMAITNLDQKQANEYLQMGRFNLQQAVNYFYNKQEKNNMKDCKQNHINKQGTDAFSELKQGAQKQFQLKKILQNLKDEYNKPIEEQLQLVGIKQEKSRVNSLSYFPPKTSNYEQLQNDFTSSIGDPITQQQKFEEEPTPVILQGKKQKFEKLNEDKKQINVNYPLLIGYCSLKASSCGPQNLSSLQKDTLVNIMIENYVSGAISKKNMSKSYRTLRIFHNQQGIARLEKKYEDILGPLLERKYIKINVFYEHSNKICDTFDPIILKGEVYLLKNSICPLDLLGDTGDINEDLRIYQETKEEFHLLFQLLNLQLLQGTLINFEKHQKKIIQQNIVQKNELPKQESIIINPKQESNFIDPNDPFKKQPKQQTLLMFKSTKNQGSQNQGSQNLSTITYSPQEQSNDIDYEQMLNLKQCQNDQLELTTPPPSFTSTLYEYQQQALTWMLMREGVISELNDQDNYRKLHPLWQEYTIPVSKINLYFNPFSGQISDCFPGSSQKCKGGLLADEMGLGKTIMLLALIHTNRPRDKVLQIQNTKIQKIQKNKSLQKNQTLQKNQSLDTFVKGNTNKMGNTLIIVPLTLVSQWEDEVKMHSQQGSIKLNVYYGTDRQRGDMSSYDIVITTYGTISHEFMQNSKSQIKQYQQSLFDYNWLRIILDEAHYIKGRTIQIAKAVYNLNGYYRWCLTGTPIQNKLDDLFSLLHFIKLEPWSDYIWWNTYINKPLEQGKKEVFEMLQMIVNPIMLRRTKKSKNDRGDFIVNLPNKDLIIHQIDFTQEEQNIYSNLEAKSKREVGGLLDRGILMTQYMKVFELILRLRQVCDHPYLLLSRSDVKNIELLDQSITKFLIDRKLKSNLQRNGDDDQYFEMVIDEQNNEEIQVAIHKKNVIQTKQYDMEQIMKYKDKTIEKIRNNEIEDCSVCQERIEDAVITSCLHFLCRLCMMGVLANQHKCPICRQYLQKEDFMSVPRESVFSLDYKENYMSSSKIDKIFEIIGESIINTNNKCVIFSQFLGMMDLIEFQLGRDGFKCLRLDGKLSQQQRCNTIKQFNDDDSFQIFLISLKAGGVGLNLTRANHIIMVDPWWNPAVEDQAIDRVHRIGQDKHVFVHKLLIRNSIEERIVEMHKQKRSLFENINNEQKTENKINLIRNLLQM